MTDLYTSKNIHDRGDRRVVRCPKCGHEWELILECTRCGHKWEPRLPNGKPKTCPNCKSPYWDKPRQNDNNKKTKRGCS